MTRHALESSGAAGEHAALETADALAETEGPEGAPAAAFPGRRLDLRVDLRDGGALPVRAVDAAFTAARKQSNDVSMAKSTPHFNDMIAARGGTGSSSTGGTKGGKMPAPPPAATPKVAGKTFGKSSAGGC